MSVSRLYAALGASLYVPATHPRLDHILAHGCHGARSIIFCTEDAVAPDAVAWAVQRLIKALKGTPRDTRHLRFVRPRSPLVLRQLIESAGALDALDGIVVPKFDSRSAARWKSVLDSAPQLPLMPTLETTALFRDATADAIGESLDELRNPVITLRIGANDLLGTLGIKREPGMTIYDTPLRSTLERIVTLFRPAGYEIAAPVCDLIGEPETLAREVAQDIAWGFYAKTCIHPSQIDVIEAHLKQAIQRQRQQANQLLTRGDAVFQDNGQMLEQTCHGSWAQRIHSLQAEYQHQQ